MKTKAPAVRRQFANAWDEINYLRDKLLFWLYQRSKPDKAIPFAKRMQKLLARSDRSQESIVGQEGRSLTFEALGDLHRAIEHREKEFFFFLLLLQTGIMGTFLALDMFLFYMFWELMLIPLYFMIGVWGSKNRLYATMKFVLYTLLGSVLMLIAVIWMYYNNGVMVNNTLQLVRTYSYEVLYFTQVSNGANATFHGSYWPFLALFLAFAIKVPLFPLHTWLPDAHTEAPTAGSVILAGILLKTGGYSIIRYCLPLFPEDLPAMAP